MKIINMKIEQAIDDILTAMKSYEMWTVHGWNDIRQKYRRSKLGPFWITISLLITIIPMSLIYGKILGEDSKSYFPYLSISLILWTFVFSICTESCTSFISSEGIIKQIKLPFTIFILRTLFRNNLLLLHNIVLIFLITIYYKIPDFLHLLIFITSIILIDLVALPVGIILAVISTRFRDFPLIVTSGLQLQFFITPIFWKVETLGNKRWIADINPLFHIFEIFRNSLLFDSFPLFSWIFVIIFGCTCWTVAVLFLSVFRNRISFWI